MRITEDHVARVKKLHEEGHSNRQIASIVGVGRTIVNKIIKGKHIVREYTKSELYDKTRRYFCKKCRATVYHPCQLCKIKGKL